MIITIRIPIYVCSRTSLSKFTSDNDIIAFKDRICSIFFHRRLYRFSRCICHLHGEFNEASCRVGTTCGVLTVIVCTIRGDDIEWCTIRHRFHGNIYDIAAEGIAGGFHRIGIGVVADNHCLHFAGNGATAVVVLQRKEADGEIALKGCLRQLVIIHPLSRAAAVVEFCRKSSQCTILRIKGFIVHSTIGVCHRCRIDICHILRTVRVDKDKGECSRFASVSDIVSSQYSANSLNILAIDILIDHSDIVAYCEGSLTICIQCTSTTIKANGSGHSYYIALSIRYPIICIFNDRIFCTTCYYSGQ